MSNVTFGEILRLLKNAFPDINIPDSFYETKKLIRGLGCDYNKIDACENDCMLFWKHDKNLDACKICKVSRWKSRAHSSRENQRKKTPKKVRRHFSLIPRLQKLYAVELTTKDMRWHAEEHHDDGILRHPADSDAWKDFDKKHVEYALEPRNVRLGLATDGFTIWEHEYQLQHMVCPFNGLQSASEIVHAATIYVDVTTYCGTHRSKTQHRRLLAAANRRVEFSVGSRDINLGCVREIELS